MARGLTLSAGLTAFFALVLVHETCSATTKVNNHCAPSSCGNINNISFPFRLKTDPKKCGDSRYELSCENNRAVLYLFEGKYYVQEINYSKYAIRIVDSGIYKDNYFHFSTSNFSLYGYNFSESDSAYTSYLPKITEPGLRGKLSRNVVLMSCEKPVNSPFYLGTSTCIDNGKSSSNTSTSHFKRYRYVKVGRTNAADVVDLCKVEQMFLTSWPRNDDPNISCKDVHNELVYGFEISWLQGNCESICKSKYTNCYLNDKNHVQCGRGG